MRVCDTDSEAAEQTRRLQRHERERNAEKEAENRCERRAEEAAKRYQKLFGCDLVCKYDGVVGSGSATN